MSTVGCAGWLVKTGFAVVGTAAVNNGALVLDRSAGVATYDDGPNLTQPGLTGDFDLTIAWQDFVPGDATPFIGPRFGAGVFWYDPSGSVYQASALVGATSGEATIVHGQQFTINQLSPSPASLVGASGSFEIQRTGSSMTVTSTINGQTASAQSTEPFPEQPLILTLWMDDSNSSGMHEAGVKVTQVTVNGGGGRVKSDDFSCP
jgi:hypothetical protein